MRDCRAVYFKRNWPIDSIRVSTHPPYDPEPTRLGLPGNRNRRNYRRIFIILGSSPHAQTFPVETVRRFKEQEQADKSKDYSCDAGLKVTFREMVSAIWSWFMASQGTIISAYIS